MPFPSNVLRTQQVKAGVALMLTFVAGFVDLVGYRHFFQTFVANMTGNTVHMANDVVERNWNLATVPAVVITSFVALSIAGRAIIEAGSRRHFQRVASFTLLLELMMVAVVAQANVPEHTAREGVWMLALLAGAMGLQTVTLTRVGPLTVHTTFVTGMLNKLAELIAHTLFLTYDIFLRGKSNARDHRRIVMRQGLYIFSIWLLYFVGAAVGAFGSLRFGLRALVIPVALLAVAILVDQLQPLSIQEEQHEMEKAA